MASTYSSNLNIEIISSGEQAGTWGDTTNQNWRRIEESRTYATINIELPVAGSDTAAGWRDSTNTYNWRLSDTEDAYTSNSDSSVGSGGRSSFVKFTGTPESDVTVIVQGNGATDYPNRVFFVKNGITGGDYKLLFDVGGTDFALQNGATAIIYCTPTGNEVGNVFDTFQVGGNAGGTTGLVLSAGSIKDVAGAVSFNDGNITNVGSIALDSIAADDGSSFAFSNNWTAAGRTCANLGTVTTADIDGGSIDGTNIGAGTKGTGAFTTLIASGDVDLGDATSDTITVAGRFDSDLIPSSDNARDLGASSAEWKDLYLDGTANIDSLVADTAAINGGSIDGVTIGTNTAATQLQVDNININANTISSTDTDGHLIIQPNGGGNVELQTDTVDIGTGTENKYITTSGTGWLKLNTNGGSSTSEIVIQHHASDANQNHIDINPNGSSNIKMFGGGGSGDLTLSDNDISGVGTVTATSFVGNLTGNASGTAGSATNATNATNVTVTDNEDENEENLIAFVADAATSTGNHGLEMDGNLTYNPSSGLLTLTQIDSKGKAGSRNFVAGAGAGNALGAGATDNIIIGDDAGDAQTTADNNILIGSNAGGNSGSLGITTAEKTILIGSNTGLKHSTATSTGEDVGIGFEALKLVGGYYNIAVGKNALTGWSGYEPHPDSPVNGVYDQIFQNVAIGTEALENTGSNEMTDNISDNTSVGYRSMRGGGSGINGASFNSAFGASSLIAINSGDNNTAIGSSAGFYITTGNNNTVVGKNSGLTLVTGNDNTLIGEDANVSVSGAVSQIAIGHNVNCTGNSTVTIGADANTASLGLDGSDTSWAAASSDERLKENIETSTAGLALIKDLRPVNYNWKKAKDVPVDMPQYVEGSDEPAFGYEYGKTLHGFIAQECKEAIDKHRNSLAEGFSLWIERDNGTQTVAPGNLIPVLVRAVQELSSKIDSLESRLAALE